MKVATNNLSIHVEQQGSGDCALVFLHYWGGSSRTWRHVTKQLARDFHCLAIDHRGWGQSDAPADGYGLADLAADAEGVIQALGLRRYLLVGHSMGGKVAQLMASRRPEGLMGLVLVAPSPPQPMAMPQPARDIMAAAYNSRQAVEATLDHMLTARTLSGEDRELAIADSLGGAPAAKAAWPRATSLEDISATVSEIAVPVLVIAGELDRVDTPDLLRAELLSRVPQAVMAILPDTGHLSMLEAPDEVSQLIHQFCDQIFIPQA